MRTAAWPLRRLSCRSTSGSDPSPSLLLAGMSLRLRFRLFFLLCLPSCTHLWQMPCWAWLGVPRTEAVQVQRLCSGAPEVYEQGHLFAMLSLLGLLGMLLFQLSPEAVAGSSIEGAAFPLGSFLPFCLI